MPSGLIPPRILDVVIFSDRADEIRDKQINVPRRSAYQRLDGVTVAHLAREFVPRATMNAMGTAFFIPS